MVNLRKISKHIILAAAIIIPLFAGLVIPFESDAQTIDPGDVSFESPPGVDLEHCAQDLTDYMNTVLSKVGNPEHALLTSISFNLSSPYEWGLYNLMNQYGANFSALDYMSGNAYTRYNQGGVGVIPAYTWYESQYGWKSSFGGKPMVFTEYGDFAVADLGIPYYGDEHIQSMRQEFIRATDNGDIVIYFAAFPGNPEFAFHNIHDEDLLSIVAGREIKAGVNSAQQLDASGAFAQKVYDLNPTTNTAHKLLYTLEIITGPNVDAVVGYINGLPPDMRPVIRSCWGSSCGMADPNVLADFILAVDERVDRPWHVLVGPNEPLTDTWASPYCGGDDDREWEWEYVRCSDVTNPEFHSLRPYPASPCPDPDQDGKILMCSNALIAEETFEFTRGEVDTSLCTTTIRDEEVAYQELDGSLNTIPFTLTDMTCPNVPVASIAEVTVDFAGAELPILGNTEDVPNASSGINSLSNEQRVNNYVSWYLQGVVPTAEEDFVSPTDPEGEKTLLNYAGPIQKLIPWEIANIFVNRSLEDSLSVGVLEPTFDDWYRSIRSEDGRLLEQVSDDFTGDGRIALKLVGDDPRHNQIVVCGGGFPEACYSQVNQSRTRKSDLAYQPASLKYPYIPLSSTEDAIANIRLSGRSGNDQPSSDATDFPPRADGRDNPYYVPFDVNDPEFTKNYDILFYAHARESNQLAKILQSTYIPDNFPSNSTSNMPPLEQLEILPYCTIVDTYSNPGDSLYGEKTAEDYQCDPADTDCILLHRDSRNIKTRIDYEAIVECEFNEIFDDAAFQSCVSPQSFSDCVSVQYCIDRGGVENPDRNPFCQAGGDTNQVYCTWSDRNADPATCLAEAISSPNCLASVQTAFNVDTESPYLEEIFNRLVYGNMSVFRRVYPRLTANNKTLREDLQDIIVPGPQELIKNIPGSTSVNYTSGNNSSSANFVAGRTIAGDPGRGTGGSSAKIYFPYLGTIHEHFLKDIQCALRPSEIGCNSTTISDQTERPAVSGACSYTSSEITQAIQFAADKYGVPNTMLEAIFRIEGFDYISNPDSYVCRENGVGAAGLTQVVRNSVYTAVTCPDERPEYSEEFASCSDIEGKLSRCSVNGAFELAARWILVNSFNSDTDFWDRRFSIADTTCEDLGDLLATETAAVYESACRYYGSCSPDSATINRAIQMHSDGLIGAYRGNSPANMGYADIVCAYMAAKDPSLGYCTTADNYPPRILHQP